MPLHGAPSFSGNRRLSNSVLGSPWLAINVASNRTPPPGTGLNDAGSD